VPPCRVSHPNAPVRNCAQTRSLLETPARLYWLNPSTNRSQRQRPKPDRPTQPHSPALVSLNCRPIVRRKDEDRRPGANSACRIWLMWEPECLLPRPGSARSQCRGFFFASVVLAKEADVLSPSTIDATSWQCSGKQGASTTPSRRSILATAARRSSPSQTAAVASTTEPLASLTVIEYR
jgi:hypothetical protein